jgi:hypothetical protein
LHQIWPGHFDVEVDIAALVLFVQARTKQDHLRAFAEHGTDRAFDGGNLGIGQAQGVIFTQPASSNSNQDAQAPFN